MLLRAHLNLLLLLSLCFPVTPAFSEVVALYPDADATLFEVAPNNSAGGQTFFISGTTQNLTRNRALLRFDIDSVLPAEATILSATLDLNVTHLGADGQESSLFGLHRVFRNWGEGSNVATDNPGGRGAPANVGDATWLYREYASVPWTAPGGAPGADYASAFSSSALISAVGSYNFESTMDTTADVQSWLAHPELNFGWMLISESEDLAFTARRFASREDLGNGPLLTLEYIVPEPAAWLIGALGLAVGCLVRRRKPCGAAYAAKVPKLAA